MQKHQRALPEVIVQAGVVVEGSSQELTVLSNKPMRRCQNHHVAGEIVTISHDKCWAILTFRFSRVVRQHPPPAKNVKTQCGGLPMEVTTKGVETMTVPEAIVRIDPKDLIAHHAEVAANASEMAKIPAKVETGDRWAARTPVEVGKSANPVVSRGTPWALLRPAVGETTDTEEMARLREAIGEQRTGVVTEVETAAAEEQAHGMGRTSLAIGEIIVKTVDERDEVKKVWAT